MRIRSLSRVLQTAALGLLTLTWLSSAGAAPQSPPPGYTVDWGPIQVVSNPALRGVYPSVVVDSNEHMHIVYLVENPDSVWDLLYTNNVDGSFAAPTIVQHNVGQERTPFFKLVIDSNDMLHLVYAWYGNDKFVYYRYGARNGAAVSWSEPQLISDGNAKAVDPYMALDAAGNAHFIWADQRCGWPIYNVFYRMRRPDGSLTPSSALKPDCSVMERTPRLTTTNDGKLHAVFTYGDELYYARLEGNQWVNRDISESRGVNTYNPTIATDGVELYTAWDDAVNGHDIRFRRSADGGQNWSNIVSFSDTPDFASYPNAVYSATRKRVYVAWGDANGQQYMQSRIWYREFDPASGATSEAQLVENQPGPAMWPVLFGARRQVALSWQDRSTSVWRALAQSGSLCGSAASAAVVSPASAGGTPDRAPSQAEKTIYLPVIQKNIYNPTGC